MARASAIARSAYSIVGRGSTGEHVGLRQIGEGGRAILTGRHPVDQRRQPAVLFGVGDVVAAVPRHAHRQPASPRLLDEVVAIDARADPPRRMFGGVVEHADEPRRARVASSFSVESSGASLSPSSASSSAW